MLLSPTYQRQCQWHHPDHYQHIAGQWEFKTKGGMTTRPDYTCKHPKVQLISIILLYMGSRHHLSFSCSLQRQESSMWPYVQERIVYCSTGTVCLSSTMETIMDFLTPKPHQLFQICTPDMWQIFTFQKFATAMLRQKMVDLHVLTTSGWMIAMWRVVNCLYMTCYKLKGSPNNNSDPKPQGTRCHNTQVKVWFLLKL